MPTAAAKAFGGQPEGRKRTLGRRGLNKKMHALRRQYIAEMTLRGYTIKSIGKQVNLAPETVKKEIVLATTDGTIDEVRAELSKTLKRVPQVFETIFDTSAEDLQKNSKGYALKMEAAKTLSEGMGTLRKETTQTTKRFNLHAYHEQRQQQYADTEADVIDTTGFVHRGDHALGAGGADDAQFSRPQLDRGGLGRGEPEGLRRDASADGRPEGGAEAEVDGDILGPENNDDEDDAA